jgi:RNA polymerase sigma-70 factor (ECF subfamily)
MTTIAEQQPPQPDVALVERLKARDKNALEDLLRLHGSKLYGVALQITRNENDAHEVMQDALITIWNKIGTFENRSSFSTWLYRVTANAALMRLRKNKKFEQNVPLDNDDPDHDLPAIQLADPRATPDAEVQRDELGVQVRTAIDKLDEPYRTTVLLADVNELSMDEIAATMGVTVPAVKSRLHRARLALRKALEPYLKGAAKS